MSRIALIADIHGNVWALRAVIGDLDRRGITAVYDLGDSLLGPLAPRETCELLMERGIPSLRGNDDLALLSVEGLSASGQYARARLTERHFEWLLALPGTRRIGDLLVCHGTPHSENDFLLDEPTAQGARLRPAAEVERLLGGERARIVACGHTHMPRLVRVQDGTMVVNPGSVGLPAWSGHGAGIESGSPHARYAVIEGDSVEHIAVAYEWSEAAAQAGANGQSDWAHWISTGRM